jgi:FAD-dependent urate hydroxylase
MSTGSETRMAARRILIIGAGIAGLSLNAALGDGPWQVEVVERGAGAYALGAGLAIQPNAMRVLRRLGLGDAVERAGAVIDRFQYRDQDGGLLCDIDLDSVWDRVGPFVGITRTALHEVLRSGPDRCRFGTSVTSVTQRGGHVAVSFADGTTTPYDLVVGADGINSVARRSLGDRPAPAHGGQMAWRSVAPIRPGGLDGLQFWLGADRFFGLCPTGAGSTYGFGNLAGARLREPIDGRKRRLIDRFATFGKPVLEYLTAIHRDSDIHCAPVESLPDVRWYDGRVVLIGDAAHAMSPMMGQGGCMAIEDALVLAEELRRASDLPTALSAFVARRQPRVAWVREQSRTLGEVVRLPEPLRNRALRERGIASFHDRYRPLTADP